MIKSMTGFCKCEAVFKNVTCAIELKSVNNRFLDAKLFLPKSFAYLEESLKKTIKQFIQRGKVDVYFQLETAAENQDQLRLDPWVWENVKEILKTLEKELDRPIPFSVSDLVGVKNLLRYERTDVLTPEEFEILFQQATEKGVKELLQMKQREGMILLDDLRQHLAAIRQLMVELPPHLAEAQERLKLKLQKNLMTLGLEDRSQEPRILQEIGILIDRSDITEEIERIQAHLVQMTELLEKDAEVGRKLDFLLQELNREVNTICSKSNHLPITQIGIALKSEIEKIREQVQNIE